MTKDRTNKQRSIVIKIIGTEGVLDEPEGDYAVKHIEDVAETAKRMILHAGQPYKNYGWSVILGEISLPPADQAHLDSIREASK